MCRSWKDERTRTRTLSVTRAELPNLIARALIELDRDLELATIVEHAVRSSQHVSDHHE